MAHKLGFVHDSYSRWIVVGGNPAVRAFERCAIFARSRWHRIRMSDRMPAGKCKRRPTQGASQVANFVACVGAVAIWALALVVVIKEVCGEPGLLDEVGTGPHLLRSEPSPAAPLRPTSTFLRLESPASSACPPARRATPRASVKGTAKPARAVLPEEKFMDER